MSNSLQLKRKSAGFTQAELAKLVGIAERRYRSYEASAEAKSRHLPDVVTAIKIAKALGTTVENIWGAMAQNLKV